MVRFFSLALALFGGALGAAACYAERPAPPSFRYTCDGPGDCRSNETCIDSLCQVECTQATFAEVCTGSDHLMCFNGLCTSACQLENENCPSSQECIDLAQFGIDLSQSGGGFLSTDSGPVGVCANLCDVDDPDACPTGESCLAGYCIASCETSKTCSSGLVCVDQLCVPEGIAVTTGGDTGIPGTFSASNTMTSAADSTGDEGSTGAGTLTTTVGTDDGGATITDGSGTAGGVQ